MTRRFVIRRPCEACNRAYIDWLANMGEVESLANADPERDPTHQHATQSEWLAHLDEIAPRTTGKDKT